MLETCFLLWLDLMNYMGQVEAAEQVAVHPFQLVLTSTISGLLDSRLKEVYPYLQVTALRILPSV